MAPILEVRELSKRYTLAHRRPAYLTLRDSLRDLFTRRGPVDELWSLRNVTFDVEAGESIGLIGRNGAGKSTLLKILCRITPPTSGHAVVRGRVASLLEVGTGFHHELTGRENIFLNGSILGLPRREILRRFDEIVAFAEIERFLDTPLKHYSTGMQMRLAFSVAAHLEPEILIVDEVLAVGDLEFQKKCVGKMQGVARSGRTVLFVSHDMTALEALCTKGVLLEHGEVRSIGPMREQIRKYVSQYAPKAFEPQSLTESLTVDAFDLSPNPVRSGDDLTFRIRIRSAEGVTCQGVAMIVNNAYGVRTAIFDFRTSEGAYRIPAGGALEIEGTVVGLGLVEGDYPLGLFLDADLPKKTFHDLTTLRVEQETEAGVVPYAPIHRGVVTFKHSFRGRITG